MKKSFSTILITDILSLLITSLPVILTGVIYYLLKVYFTISVTVLSVTLAFMLLPLFFIFSCFLIRVLLLPKLKNGTYNLNLNKGYIAWGLHLSLGRSIRVFQLKDLIFSSYLLKYLYWRAMGAQIAFGINSSMYVNLIDLPLIKIDSGVTLGDNVQLSCHIIADGKLVLGNIKIGENTFVSFDTQIGPMSKIGKNCIVGPDQNFIKLKLKDGQSTQRKG